MSYICKTNLSAGPQFGSQMTQYAGLYAVSRKLDAEIVFILEQMNFFRGVKLFDAFSLHNKIIGMNDIKFSSFTLKHDECLDSRVFNLSPSVNWDIGGLFHTCKYFHEYEKDIQNIFTFKDSIKEVATQKINEIKQSESYPLVSLHIRRGDYLEVSSLNLDLSYYNEALSIFLNKFDNNYFKLVVFSDDISWCKQNIIGENVFYSENNSNYVDMCMMSMCDHHIVANSSFSWWGAYLNPSSDKLVVCPYEYIGSSDTQHQFINGNYFPDSWTSIKIY